MTAELPACPKQALSGDLVYFLRKETTGQIATWLRSDPEPHRSRNDVPAFACLCATGMESCCMVFQAMRLLGRCGIIDRIANDVVVKFG